MTQKQSHTPGPWAVGQTYLENNQSVTQIMDGDLNGPVAYVSRSVLSNAQYGEEVKSNARLIAAAPEMLELLKIIANGGVGQFQWSMTKAEKLAQAAIAKAGA